VKIKIVAKEIVILDHHIHHLLKGLIDEAEKCHHIFRMKG
jgi:hypothetical protein